VHYNVLPTLADFAKDVGRASYSQQQDERVHPVMRRIFSLLGWANQTTDDARKKYLMCELFFATRYWLRNQKDENVAPAVRALNGLIENKLHDAFRCPLNLVAATLAKYYDCPVDSHGIYVDTRDCLRQAPNSIEKVKLASKYEAFRVYFVKGLVLSYNWRTTTETELRPINSADDLYALNAPLPDHVNFVLTRYRELYFAPFSDSPQTPRYHSSIPNQEAVHSAGSMEIVNGRIIEICHGSGHYKPGDLYFVNILEQLKTEGASIKGIKLSTFIPTQVRGVGKKVDVAEDAQDYLQNFGNWDQIQKRREFDKARRKDQALGLKTTEIFQRFQKLATASGNRDKALATLFEEQFEKSPLKDLTAWKQTWQGVMAALVDIAPEYASYKYEGVDVWIEKKDKAFKAQPPPPPRPKVQVHV